MKLHPLPTHNSKVVTKASDKLADLPRFPVARPRQFRIVDVHLLASGVPVAHASALFIPVHSAACSQQERENNARQS